MSAKILVKVVNSRDRRVTLSSRAELLAAFID
jgi:hypothetical protein